MAALAVDDVGIEGSVELDLVGGRIDGRVLADIDLFYRYIMSVG
jgi:hypothetical protein